MIPTSWYSHPLKCALHTCVFFYKQNMAKWNVNSKIRLSKTMMPSCLPSLSRAFQLVHYREASCYIMNYSMALWSSACDKGLRVSCSWWPVRNWVTLTVHKELILAKSFEIGSLSGWVFRCPSLSQRLDCSLGEES